MTEAHKWEFKAGFRRHAFGWKSQPAITRIKPAVAEIKKVAKKDPVLAAEGAIAYGYEITSVGMWDAYRATLAAAEGHGSAAEVRKRVRKMVAAEGAGERFVTKVLGRELGL